MSSDLHVKISDILSKYLKDVPMRERDAIALVDELANIVNRPDTLPVKSCRSCNNKECPFFDDTEPCDSWVEF